MTDQILRAVEAPVNENIPQLRSGDIVSVHVKIKEGDRERIQDRVHAHVIRGLPGPGGVSRRRR